MVRVRQETGNGKRETVNGTRNLGDKRSTGHVTRPKGLFLEILGRYGNCGCHGA